MSQTKVTDAMRNVTAVDATKISGAVPSASLTNVDLSKLEYNQAILAFKVASANQLAKFSMVDQVIDEYQDATGIDAGASTNENAGGATTAKYYYGGTSVTPTATGGTVTTDGDYKIHSFTADGSYVNNYKQTVEYLIVGGGGGGMGHTGNTYGYGDGGGGGGGFLTATDVAMPATTYAVTVGLGATTRSSDASNGTGGNSIISGTGFSTLTAYGGGGGGNGQTPALPEVGGSGGGAGGSSNSGAAATSTTPSQGYAGGNGHNSGGGGGGAGGAGVAAPSSAVGGAGGAGKASSITGSSVTYAGGGGGGGNTGGAAGTGGGGAGGHSTSVAGAAGTDGTGGGGGGGPYNGTGADGGNGIVIIRRPTTTIAATNLTLQSTATTAESAPTTADLVVLIEDKEGTTGLNTDIKGYVSRDGSAFSSAVTFVDEGDWGADKRILVARNIDISGITTGTSMKYKLTTHNQVPSSKETYIHATSLAWA